MRKINYKVLIIILLNVILIQGRVYSQEEIPYEITSSHDAFYSPSPKMANSFSRDYIPQSPTAASLGAFGNISVGHFTGAPQINLNLYTILDNDISVPINLVYDHSSNKPETLPGTVGIGWTLQAGGCITRVINGTADLYPEHNPWGEGCISVIEDSRYTRTNWPALSRHEKDRTAGECYPINYEGAYYPDKYIFNFNGYKGTFYMGDGEFKVQSQSGDYLSVSVESTNKNDITFTMIDTKGIKYVFGGPDCTEYSHCGIRQNNAGSTRHSELKTPMSWYLQKIESPTGSEVFFEYEVYRTVVKTHFTDFCAYETHSSPAYAGDVYTPEGETWYLIYGLALRYIHAGIDWIVFEYSDSSEQLDYPNLPSGEDREYFYEKNVYYRGADPDYEGSPNFYNTMLDLRTSTPPRLDRIEFLCGTHNSFVFKYPENRASRRLRLSEVSEESPSGYFRLYGFEYNSTDLPDYHSEMTDYYGFYNGKSTFNHSNPESILHTLGEMHESTYRPNNGKVQLASRYNFDYIESQMPEFERKIGESKEPDGDLAQAEILTKLIYPTGGYSQFIYEPHKYGRKYKTWPFETVENENFEELLTGGVRIKKIENYDYTGVKLTEKFYHYIKNYQTVKNSNTTGVSSGVLVYQPTLIEFVRNKFYFCEDYRPSYTGGEQYGFFRINSNPVFPISDYGTHITYSEVTVEEPGNGFTTYKYKNFDNGYADKEPLDYCSSCFSDNIEYIENPDYMYRNDPGISMELERGQPSSIEIFDESGVLRKKTELTYNDSEERFDSHIRFIRHEPNSFQAIGRPSARVTTGVHYTYFPYLKEKTETSYYNSGNYTIKEEYSYNEDFGLLKSIRSENSAGDEYGIEIDYVANYHQTRSSIDLHTEPEVITDMKARGLFASVLEEKLTMPGGREISSFYEYRNDMGASFPLLYRKFKKFSDNSTANEIIINKYGNYHKPCFITLNGTRNICLLWDNTLHKPVVQIENITYNELLSVVGGGYMNQFMAGMNSNLVSYARTLSGDSRLKNAFFSFYTYSPANKSPLGSETDPRGNTVYYDYDEFDRLKEIYHMDDNRKTLLEDYLYHYSTVPADQNYIRTRTYLDENNTALRLENTNYFDGLGYPIQAIQKGFTPQGNDLAVVQEYDAYRRESRTWLPVPVQRNNANFIASIREHARNYYGPDTLTYTTTLYEASPLDVATAVQGPGMAWEGRSQNVYTTVNGTDYPCYRFTYSGTTITNHGLYPAGSLKVVHTLDEDNCEIIGFYDKMGRLLLQRQRMVADEPEIIVQSSPPMGGGLGSALNYINYDTYYIYDALNNPLLVLPPLASDVAGRSSSFSVSDSFMQQYAYIYEYNAKGLCTSKKIPGADPIYYKYDTADRLIFSQDGEQRPSGEWSFSFPDALGRPVVTGTCKNVPASISGVVNAAYTGSGSLYGYTYTGITTTLNSVRVLQVSYYDNYNFKNLSSFGSGFGYLTPDGFENKRYGSDSNDLVSAKGLLTGSLTALLDGSGTLLGSVFYYDNRGRMIQSVAQNHLGGYEKEYVNYNFTGQPTRRQTVHTTNASGYTYAATTPLTQTYTYSYDHAGRLTETKLKVGTDSEVSLSKLEHNELGQLKKKTVHGGKAPVAYAYNIRGWMKEIQSAEFTQSLYYNESYQSNTPRHNGNISAVSYYQGSNDLNRFRYTYDGLNRLTKSEYFSSDLRLNGSFNEEMTYDKMGNITSLKRFDYSTQMNVLWFMDVLTITYNGNQLNRITDSADRTLGFVGGNISGAHYVYNKNGAMTMDKNKGITAIEYNLLNLPNRIDFGEGNATYYLYDAAGVKRRVSHSTSQSATGTGTGVGIIGSIGLAVLVPTDYCGTVIYESGQLKRILTPEGYLTLNGLATGQVDPRDIKIVDVGGALYEAVHEVAKASEEGVRTVVVPVAGDAESGKIIAPSQGPKFRYNYFVNDYLGNVRAVLTWNKDGLTTSNYTVSQKNDYYAFGLPTSTSVNPEAQPYKREGKEYDEMHGLGWADFHSRFFDLALPHTPTRDWHAENYYNMSPYAQHGSNPVMCIDPDGMDYWFTNNPGQIKAFWDAVKGGGSPWIDISGWNHVSDNDFLSNLHFNDETGNFFFSYVNMDGGGGGGVGIEGWTVTGAFFSVPLDIWTTSYFSSTIERNGILYAYNPETGITGQVLGERPLKTVYPEFFILLGGRVISNFKAGKSLMRYPGNDPTKTPKGFEWRGSPNSQPGSNNGNWYNPQTGESLHPDLDHPEPIGPHWDYRDSSGKWWRIFRNGKIMPK